MCSECEESLCNDSKNNIKIRKMFWEILPKNKSQVNWKESVGYKVKGIYDDIEFEVKIVDYDGKYLWIKYLDKEPFKIKTNNFQRCILGKLLGKYTNEFKIEKNTTFKDDRRNITIVDRKYKEDKKGQNLKYYQYKCNICGWLDDMSWIDEYSLLGGQGCSCCYRRTIVEGINDIPTTAPWMVKYFQSGYNEAKLYSECSGQKIYFKCPDCGRIKDKPLSISNLYNCHSIGCSCSDGKSYGEKFMFSVLGQLNIPFETEKIFEWCKYEYKNKLRQGKYDFLFNLNNKEYTVETDGGFHTRDNNMTGQTAEESQEIDDYKDNMAREHDIEPIRIDCNESNLEYIKDKIMHSRLDELFDLSVIDWLKCEEFALSNLVKKACEIKRDNPSINTIDIATLMSISRNTIINYLKIGTKLNWCHYDAKEEMRKSGLKMRKQVEIFKDNKSLGIFKSVTELQIQSEKLFGVKLDNGAISLVCNGKTKQRKGFTFKYVENNIKQVI